MQPNITAVSYTHLDVYKRQLAGLGVFVLTKMGFTMEADIALIAPLAVSFVFYAGIGLINKYALKMQVKPEVEDLMVKLGKDE